MLNWDPEILKSYRFEEAHRAGQRSDHKHHKEKESESSHSVVLAD